MLDDTRVREALEGLVGFDWETADLDEVALLASRLGWEELEVDDVMASAGDPGDDGWIAAGLDEDELVFELIVMLQLWDAEEVEPAVAAALGDVAFEHALAVCGAVLGVPGHVATFTSGGGQTGRVAHWRAGDGVVSLYLGVRDDEFGTELALFSEAATDDEGWPGLEFLLVE